MTQTAQLTLADFLLARITEDEAEWRAYESDSEVRLPKATAARALAECATRRALIAYCSPADDTNDALLGMFADPTVDASTLAAVEPLARAAGQMVDHAVAHVLNYLALPYADHPDYRSEWAV